MDGVLSAERALAYPRLPKEHARPKPIRNGEYVLLVPPVLYATLKTALDVEPITPVVRSIYIYRKYIDIEMYT